MRQLAASVAAALIALTVVAACSEDPITVPPVGFPIIQLHARFIGPAGQPVPNAQMTAFVFPSSRLSKNGAFGLA